MSRPDAGRNYFVATATLHATVQAKKKKKKKKKKRKKKEIPTHSQARLG